MEYRGSNFEEMDVDAVLARKPERVLVDELAHTNVPGSRNEKRWQDVNELLDAGIDVISTVNVQHLESMNDVVEQITGIKQQETIPDAIVRSADAIELVDMSPEALRRRMAHGNIYPPEKVDASLANFFRQGNLGALRELALMWLADRVDEALEEYRETHGIDSPWETRERVVVAITGAPSGDDVIRRAARMAARTHGELIGVHVRSSDGLRGPQGSELEDQRRLLDELGGEYREIAGADTSAALVRFAHAENATQIVLGASQQSRWTHLIRGSVITNVIRASGDIDVHVISAPADEAATGERDGGPRRLRQRRRILAVSPRRRTLAWALALAGPPLVTLVLAQLRDALTLPSDLLVLLLLVVVVAALGGFVPAFVCAISSFLFANWFFTPPFYEFTVSEGENLLALGIFLLVGGVVSVLVSTASRRTVEAAHARAEAETLASLSGTLVAAADPLPQLVAQVQAAFEAESVGVLSRSGSGWVVVAGVGPTVPEGPDAADLAVPLSDHDVLVVRGADLGPDDLDVLQAFAGQVAIAVQQRALRADAARAGDLEEANELRTALLAAVSHDLRTPLSSIKASVSSLLQRDVDFTPAATRELLETIDDGADRLNHLIGNLLDMSRLQTGAVQLVMRAVALEEIIPAALAGLSEAERVDTDVPETLPRVQADAALARTRRRQRDRECAEVVAVRHARARRSVRGRRSRRLARRRPRRRDTTCTARAGVSAVPTPRRQLERHRRGARPRGRARFRRGDGRHDHGRRHARWRRHHRHRSRSVAPWHARLGGRRRAADLARARHQPARAGYDVDLAPDGEQALDLAARHHPDVVVLDLGLPGIDGVDVIRGLRGWSSVPIVVLSVRDAETDKVAALDAGADDYVTKPFGMDELLARLRGGALRRATPSDEEPIVETPDFSIDLAAKQVHRGGAEIRLTPTEWHLAEVLVRNPGKLVSQQQLLHEVWGPEYHDESAYLARAHGQPAPKARARAEPSPLLSHRARDGLPLRALMMRRSLRRRVPAPRTFAPALRLG